MAELQITENFLKALDRYLSGEILMDEAVEEASLKTRKQFHERMRVAYARHMLAVHAYIHPDLCTRMREGIGPTRGIEAYVVKGRSDDRTFYLSAAEKFLIFMRNMLLDEKTNEINIGIISGSSTASTVEHAINGGFWQEVMNGPIEERRREGKPIQKSIKIIAINPTTLEDWELQGNANIWALMLARMLYDKLPDCEVTPYGVSTDLVIPETERRNVDNRPSNKRILEIVDPERLGLKRKSKLNLLITGVGARTKRGTRPNSVFQKVIESEQIPVPQPMVGDVAFVPVDRDGRELKLSKQGNKYIVYSAISLPTMKQLASEGGIVMLIARNLRKGEIVDKTDAIRAAIRGKYINVVFTDERTATSILSQPI